MSEFVVRKIDFDKINNGNKYKNGDIISPSDLNAIVEGVGYEKPLYRHFIISQGGGAQNYSDYSYYVCMEVYSHSHTQFNSFSDIISNANALGTTTDIKYSVSSGYVYSNNTSFIPSYIYKPNASDYTVLHFLFSGGGEMDMPLSVGTFTDDVSVVK